MIKLSKKLSRAIGEDAMDCVTGDPKLAKNDIEALARILTGEDEPSAPVNRKRAVNTFVRVSPAGESVPVLAKILGDADESPATRISAAWGLGRSGDPRAEKALIRALDDAGGNLQREVVKALGRVGSAKGLEALDAVHANGDAALQRLVSLSRTLVSYRVKGGKPDAGKIREQLGLDWVETRPKKLTKGKVEGHVEALRGDTLGLELSRDLGLELDCGENGKNTVLFSDQVEPGRLIDSLFKTSRVSALVTLQNPREKRSTLRYVVMTNVTEGGADIVVTRTTGELVLAGEATPDGDGWRFDVRDVGRVLPPTSISGVVTDKAIEMRVKTMGARRAKAGLAV
jgi:hypothetical protein